LRIVDGTRDREVIYQEIVPQINADLRLN